MLPIVFVGPIAGVFVDRWPIKPTLIASDLLRAGLALLLIPATSVWQVYGVLAALSCVSAFFGPAQTVTIRSHVPIAGLMSANALMQIAFMGSRIVGPAIAGAIVVGVHAAGLLLRSTSSSFLVSASLIASVAIVRPASLLAPAGSSSNRIHADLDRHEGGLVVHHPSRRDPVLRDRDGRRAVHDRLLRAADLDLRARHAARRAPACSATSAAWSASACCVGTQIIRQIARRMVSDTGLVLWGLVGIGAGVLLLGAVPHIAATLRRDVHDRLRVRARSWCRPRR